MGKQRRSKPRRPTPLGRSTISPDQRSDNRVREEKVLPLIKSLKSSRPAERASAISAINVAVEDPKIQQLFLDSDLVGTILAHTLTDNSLEIVAEGYGLLRNLMLTAEVDVESKLLELNILSSISAILAKLSPLWESNPPSPANRSDAPVLDLTENILALISAIGRSGDDAVVNSSSAAFGALATNFALKVLTSGDSKASDQAAEALYVCTRDNAQAANMAIKELKDAASHNALDVARPEIFGYFLGVRFNSMNGDLGAIIAQTEAVFANLKSIVKFVDGRAIFPVFDGQESSEDYSIRTLMSNVEVALEIDGAALETLGRLEKTSTTPVLAYVANNLLDHFLTCVAAPSLADHAFTAINNFVWAAVSLKYSGWEVHAKTLWNQLEGLLFSEDPERSASALSVLAAISKEFPGVVDFTSSGLETAVSRLLDLSPRENEPRDLWVKRAQSSLNLLTVLSAQDSAPEITNRTAVLLFEILSSPEQAGIQVVLESIEAVIDIFDDNEAPRNSVYVNNGFNMRLKALLQPLTSYLVSEAMDNPEYAEQAEQAAEWLDDFVQYKDEH